MKILHAQDTHFFENFEKAILRKDARTMARLLNVPTEINIANKSNTYNRTQAEQFFYTFFSKNPPDNFNIIHKGKSKGRGWFAIGRYEGSNQDYSLLVRLKPYNNIHLIYEIIFVEE